MQGRIVPARMALTLAEVEPKWRAFRSIMRAGSIARPGQNTFFDPVRQILGSPETSPAADTSYDGAGVALTQTAGATGGRIDMGELPFMDEFTAVARFMPLSGSGSVYGNVLCRGDGVFGNDTMFSMGYRPGSNDVFAYGRSGGSLLGGETASTIPEGVMTTMILRWRNGSQKLWMQGIDASGNLRIFKPISTTSGNGSDGNESLWVGGGQDMADHASEATPPIIINTWSVYEGFATDAQALALLNDPYGPLRYYRRTIVPAGGGSGNTVTENLSETFSFSETLDDFADHDETMEEGSGTFTESLSREYDGNAQLVETFSFSETLAHSVNEADPPQEYTHNLLESLTFSENMQVLVNGTATGRGHGKGKGRWDRERWRRFHGGDFS